MWNYVLKYSSLGKTNNIQVIIELYLSVKRERSVFSFLYVGHVAEQMG